MLQQNPSVLEPAAVGGEAVSKPAGSMKPACPASTSPLNWLADLTSGNVNKENKGECFLLSCLFLSILVHSWKDLATSVAGRTVVRSPVEWKVLLWSHPGTCHKWKCFWNAVPKRRNFFALKCRDFYLLAVLQKRRTAGHFFHIKIWDKILMNQIWHCKWRNIWMLDYTWISGKTFT